MKKLLRNKTAIITGGNQGLGLKIAEFFLKNGANVIIAARNKNKINDAIELLSPFCEENIIIGKKTDITNKVECDDLISTTMQKLNRIDILVNNAGIIGAKGKLDELDWKIWESAIDVNLKGTVFLCHRILPIMKKQLSGKIIILSGGGATKPTPTMSAYAASKAALVRFSECLALEMAPYHIDVNAVAPGALNTQMLEDILQAGPKLIDETLYQKAAAQQKNGGDNPERAANLCVFLASDKSNGITGKLISAIWDPWETLSDYRDQLIHSDIYTLRRIVPEDRKMDWKS